MAGIKIRSFFSYLNRSKFRFLTVLLLCLSIAIVLSYIFTARNTLVIRDEGAVTEINYNGDTEQALLEAGIQLSERDSYTLNPDGVPELVIRRAKTVTVIFDDGSSRSVLCNGLTVGDALAQMGLTLGENDRLDCPADTALTDNMYVHFYEGMSEFSIYESSLPYETIYIDTDALPEGQFSQIQPGQDGRLQRIYRRIYCGGELVSSGIYQEDVLQKPVPCMMWRGTAAADSVNVFSALSGTGYARSRFVESPSPSPAGGSMPILSDDGRYITTASGDRLRYSRKVDVSATAYTTELFSSPSPTYSGTTARVGAIAVDKNVIPLGSKLYIVGEDGSWIYGYASAEDLGGGIKGNRVDLFFDTHAECVNFGCRAAQVYILD